MGSDAGQYNKTSTPHGIFIVTPSLEGWPTKAREAPSPHQVRLTLLTLHVSLIHLHLYGIINQK